MHGTLLLASNMFASKILILILCSVDGSRAYPVAESRQWPQLPSLPMFPIEINVPDTISSMFQALATMWNLLSMYYSPADMEMESPMELQ